MTREERCKYWEGIVSEAYQSGEAIEMWCEEHCISTTSFHRWGKRLGYTKGGKRTVKCLSLIGSDTQHISVPNVSSSPAFVEVPAHTVTALSDATNSICSRDALITVQAGAYQVGIRDGFNEHTLSKVLEVLRHA